MLNIFNQQLHHIVDQAEKGLQFLALFGHFTQQTIVTDFQEVHLYFRHTGLKKTQEKNNLVLLEVKPAWRAGGARDIQ